MAIVTGAEVWLHDDQQLIADCFGNNVAVLCPQCKKAPVLLIARKHHRGSADENPAKCVGCEAAMYITDKLPPGTKLRVIHVALVGRSPRNSRTKREDAGRS